MKPKLSDRIYNYLRQQDDSPHELLREAAKKLNDMEVQIACLRIGLERLERQKGGLEEEPDEFY